MEIDFTEALHKLLRARQEVKAVFLGINGVKILKNQPETKKILPKKRYWEVLHYVIQAEPLIQTITTNPTLFHPFSILKFKNLILMMPTLKRNIFQM